MVLVIMVNRKEDQGNTAINAIKEEAGDGADIAWIPCDMGYLKQIKETIRSFYRKKSD